MSPENTQRPQVSERLMLIPAILKNSTTGYKNVRDREWLPGWVLPLEWMDEDPVERGTGVPDIGQLLVT